MNGKAFVFGAWLAVCARAFGEPVVSDVIVQPRWPWSAKVDVHFVLSGVEAPVDVECAFSNGGADLSVPAASLSGDLADLVNGAYTITWDPGEAGLAEARKLDSLAVELSPVPAKTWMIVDLAASLADTAEARISYTNEVVGANGEWSDYCKTNCVVLRRIKAGSFTMGAKSGESSRGIETGFRRNVTLTKDFYIGVFEVPQTLYKKVLGSGYPYKSGEDFTIDADFRPVARVGYGHLRNDSWSCTNTLAEARTVTDTSWIGKFRAKTGGALLFDLPTEAQWEYACRAGTDSSFYNGLDISSASAATDTNLDALGVRYKGNGGWAAGWSAVPSDPSSVGTENGTARIGSCIPNAWGLYDMLGNADEWVLDWAVDSANHALFAEAVAQTVDPRGPSLSNNANNCRVFKGGSFNRDASGCRSSSRYPGKSATGSRKEQWAGFRLCLTPNEF